VALLKSTWRHGVSSPPSILHGGNTNERVLPLSTIKLPIPEMPNLPTAMSELRRKQKNGTVDS